MFRKLIRIIASVLSVVLIIDGLYRILVKGTHDWGLIIIGVFFLIAVGPEIYDDFRRR